LALLHLRNTLGKLGIAFECIYGHHFSLMTSLYMVNSQTYCPYHPPS
jgi:hypothetical protein